MSGFKELRKEKIIYRIGIILLSVWFGASGFMENH